jgi:insertion element IS1 protein InsB
MNFLMGLGLALPRSGKNWLPGIFFDNFRLANQNFCGKPIFGATSKACSLGGLKLARSSRQPASGHKLKVAYSSYQVETQTKPFPAVPIPVCHNLEPLDLLDYVFVAIERNNGRQRHWFARFRRKSIVVSKSFRMVELTMALFARFHVNGLIEEISTFSC